MKVLHITPTFYPNVGGVEVFVMDLATLQKKEGLDVRVLCLDNNNPPIDKINGIEIHRTRYLYLKYYKLSYLDMKELKWPDVIHVHCLGFPTDFIAVTKFFHKKPCVLTTYGGIFHTTKILPLKKFYFNYIEHLLLSKYNYIVSVSETDYKIFSKIVKPEKLKLIPLGVFLEEFPFHRRDSNRPYFLYIGRISKNKNLINLLKTFKLIFQFEPSTRLIILGGDFDGSINEIQKFISENALEKFVELTGYLPHNQISHLCKESYYFVSASLFESFGIALTEAMSTGLIPIVQDIPAHREQVVDGVNGFIVDFNIPENTAEKIATILRNIDYQSMSKKASSFAQRFNIYQIYEQYIQIYKSIIELNKRDSQ